MKFFIKATAIAKTANELASKIMVGAYTQDIDLGDLDITPFPDEEADSMPYPEAETTFQFPHIKQLIDHLNEGDIDER